MAQSAEFLFGRPSSIAETLGGRIRTGVLFVDLWASLRGIILGFVAGNVVGILLGLALWRWKTLDHIVRPYLIGLGAVPAFALAPVLVVWFGTGLLSKVVLVFLSTVLVATFHASAGASEVDEDYFKLFRSFRATEYAMFMYLILPSSAVWLLAGLRLNIGFALLGEFIGEFISSEEGIAHRILIDAGLYDISAVWAGIVVLAGLALILYYLIHLLERVLLPWQRNGLTGPAGSNISLHQ